MLSLAPRVDDHIDKIGAEEESIDLSHWRGEAENWVAQIEAMLPYIGERTGEEWGKRIVEWKKRLNVLK